MTAYTSMTDANHTHAPRTRRIRTRLAGESGIALPTAVIVLFIVTILAGTAVAVAVQTASSTRKDDNRKAALEAAEAGLRVARYRLTVIAPSSGEECVGTAEEKSGKRTEAPTVNGSECVSNTESLGNNTTYKYWTSVEEPSSCVGTTVTVNSPKSVGQRCVTAIGTAGVGTSGEVTRRLEERVATFTAAPLFIAKGIVGLEGITINGSDHILSALGTNKEIHGVGSFTGSGEVVLGPNGTTSLPGGFTVTKTSVEQSPLVLSPVNPGNSATVNDNQRILNGFEKIKPEDSSNGNVTLNANRELSLKGNSTLNLGGETYNFCSLNAGGSSTLAIAPGAHVRIFIDSPEDPNSGCPSGSGEFAFAGGLSTPSGDPTALQFYIYGKGPVSYSGNVNAAATIYAPQAEVKLGGTATLTGGVEAKSVSIGGTINFNWDERDAALQAKPAVMYYRTAWAECTPTVTASEPQSGC